MDADPKLLSRQELETEVLRLRAGRDAAHNAGSEGTQPLVSRRRSTPAAADVLFSAVDKTRLPMIVTDPNQPDDPIVFANRAFLEMTGYGADEVIGRNCRFLQGPETEPDRIDEIRAALVENRDAALEITNHRKDGTVFVNNLFVGPVFGADGQLLYRFGSQFDVTEAHRNRDRLAESEARQRAIFDSAIELAIIAADREGRITDWNVGAERILGWSSAEAHGRSIDDIFTPEDRAAGRPAYEMRRALADGRAEDERWHLRRDGGRFFAAGDMTPLRGADGKHHGFVKAISDHTERREAAARVTANEARYRGLFDAIDAGFCIFEVCFDDEGTPVDYRFLEANPAFTVQTGLTDPVGRRIRELSPDHEQAWFDSYGAVARTGEPQRVEGRAEALGRDYEVYAFRVGEPDQHRVAALFYDVTGRKAAEARQAALVGLGERLRDLASVPAMVEAAIEVAGRTLRLARVGVAHPSPDGTAADVVACWTGRDVPDILGRHDLAEFGAVRESVTAGRAIIVPDVRTDAETADGAAALLRLGIAAMINTPVFERGRPVEMLFAHDDRPRPWTTEDVGFLRAIADRLQVGVARARAEERQALQNRELSHRMKNLLAMVQSIVAQTMRAASEVGTARDVLGGRLIALGKAHDLLMGGAVASTRIGDVVRGALAVHGDGLDRFRLSGPEEEIGADQALSLSLMLHELATNAAKYGALANGEGHVELSWERLTGDGEPLLRLSWRERGGPPVQPPTRKGFGSRFIERALAVQVGGDLKLEYPSDGVACTLTAPLAAFRAVRPQ